MKHAIALSLFLLGISGMFAGNLIAQAMPSSFPYRALIQGAAVKNTLYRAAVGPENVRHFGGGH